MKTLNAISYVGRGVSKDTERPSKSQGKDCATLAVS